MFRLCGFSNYFQLRKCFTKLVASSIHGLSILLELLTYWRFYYRRSLTCTLECLFLFVACLTLDILIWKAHYAMTYNDPGFLNDSPTIVEASKLGREDFVTLVEATIQKITGLARDSP